MNDLNMLLSCCRTKTSVVRYDGLRPDFGNEACFFDKDNSLANFVFFHALLIVIQVSIIIIITIYISQLQGGQSCCTLRFVDTKLRVAF